MRAARASLAAAVRGCGIGSHRSLRILAGLAVLVALGGLQPAPGTPRIAPGSAVVMGDAAAGPVAVAVRSVRQLPAPQAAPTFHPAWATPAAVVGFVLLLAVWPPMWMRSRRSRQAHLLVSAGPGPPSYS